MATEPDPAQARLPVPNLTGKSRFNWVHVRGKLGFLVQGQGRGMMMEVYYSAQNVVCPIMYLCLVFLSGLFWFVFM